MMTSFGLAQFLFAPVMGNLGDLLGRKYMLILCSVGAALGYLLGGLAVSGWMLVASRLFVGGIKFTMVSLCFVSLMLVIH